VQGWPSSPFEGELWAGLGQFEQATSVIQQKQAPDNEWRDMRFMVFDAPTPNKPFTERIPLYQGVVKQIGKPWVQAAQQNQIQSRPALKTPKEKTRQPLASGSLIAIAG
jgi:DNA ligase 1